MNSQKTNNPTKKPDISVVIPTYNRAKYLPEALDSVLEQRGHDYSLEVIVVDDGSTDGTDKLIREKYQDKVIYKKLRKNTGMPAVVRNHGMKLARGELIAFQDSDDLWTNEKIAAQMPLFDNPDVVFVYGDCGYINPSGKIIEGKRGMTSEPVNGYAFMRKVSRQSSPFPTPTVILRRSVIEEVGMFNEKLRIATDTDYWIRVATVGKFAYCNQLVAYMRRDGSNISSRPDESGDQAIYKHELNRINMFEHILKEVELTDVEKAALRYRIAELHLEVAIAARMLGKKIPFDLNEVSLPPRPKRLARVNKQYGQKVITPIKESLLLTIGRWPRVYVGTFVAIKKSTRPIRRWFESR